MGKGEAGEEGTGKGGVNGEGKERGEKKKGKGGVEIGDREGKREGKVSLHVDGYTQNLLQTF